MEKLLNIVNVAGISSAIVLVEPGVAGTKTGLDAVVTQTLVLLGTQRWKHDG